MKITKIKSWIFKHKITSFIILLIIIGGGYYIYKKANTANATPQYVLSPARIGTITQTVTGSGQVSAENQLDVTSEVSGKIQTINVSVGQHVNRGTLLATIDSHDASISLESARIAYAKLVKPAKEGDLTNAQNSLTKSYNDGFSSVSTLYLDLPNIITGIKDLLYSPTGFLSDQRSSYLTQTGRTYRDMAGVNYDKAIEQYQKTLSQYKNITRTSATSSIDSLIDNSYTTAKMMAVALQNVQNAINFIITSQPDYQASNASTVAANVVSWSNQINSDLSSLVSAQNSITTNNNSLETLITGADSLDIQSQKLSLQQAEESYAKYFIRAPFDGIVGRIPVSVYGQAGASTIIATVIGDQKIANISLNEVDAAKVQSGQTVHITFDAIDGLNALGTVGQVDLVGTVSQGVVSYNVKVIINTSDERIKPGMSVNISIVTKEKTGILIVPSSAIKTQGTKKYVEILSIPNSTSTPRINASGYYRQNSTSTDSGIGNIGTNINASSTRMNGSSTTNQTKTITITSATTPKQSIVSIGDSDDTNTEILSGIERGQFVVTRTIASGTATTATPNILSSLGGNRGAAGATGSATRAAARPGN